MLQPRRLLSTSLLSRRAAELGFNTSSSVIPQPLDVLLPSCSKPCLRAFIADSYPSSSSKNIDTLCTTNTTSGFTLGEAALICENSYCAVEGQVDKGIFSICANVPRAIRPSHNAITVVPMATSDLTPGSNAFSSALPPVIGPPPTTSVDTTKIATATRAPSTTPAPFSPLPPFPTSSSTLSFRETASASPSTSTASVSSSTTTQPAESDAASTSGLSPTVTPTTSSAQGSLNTGQIVGICLAAVAIFGFVLGALLLLYRRRREINRKRRGSRWSDSIEKQPPSPFSPADHHIEAGVSNPRAATPDHSQRFYAPPTRTQEKRRSFWRRSIKPEDIGVAVSPEVVQAGSPTSVSSQRTTSQLLPEFPHYSLWPAPLRKTQQNPATFEQRRPPERPTVTFPSTFVGHKKVNKPPRIVSSRTGNGLPTDPRAQMYRLGQAKSVNDKIPRTPVYDNGNVSMTLGAILSPRQHGFLQPGHPSQAQRKYDPYLQDQKVAPNPIPAQTIKLLPPSPPPSPPPAHFEASSSRRAPPLRRGSSASDATNIEDDEDTTPEQETDKQLRPRPLSPVLESPRHYSLSPIERLTSPVNDHAYPSPPRPAAISKQAEKQPRPRVVEFADTLGRTSSPLRTLTEVASRRDHLIQEERSLLSTASSSASSPLRKRDESPSTLLAKRKGDRAADQMLQHGLRLSSSAANALSRSRYQANTQTETRARKGSDTENDNGINTVLMTPPPKGGQGLKSPPFWTPKLTPTRRGEDLFLRVE
ncbi:hypothetical protein GJ744_010683 [Endocarpon pusillum]|uniref:Extracellular membrane protein CFEM domain-containing protein n=1 Tax=Endocarpon pusillum TaxID=364733 RepID=A0A8H7AHW4_9EURO|nr:hypothetical protein GJ744_010683 [Endocarpon pusillum]